MDFVELLGLTFKTLAALIVFYIVFLIITGWRSEKPRETPLVRRATCEGERNGGACGKPVYRCGTCGESGCELNGCSHRRFEPPGKCLSCGYPNAMQRF